VSGGAEGALVQFARERLLKRTEQAQERVWLVSPFLTLPIALKIGEAAARSEAHDRRLLTALDPRSIQVGVLDPKALSTLHECGFEIASIANLHAKVSLVDTDWGLVGSGNLTGSGLGWRGSGNRELGVLLTRRQIGIATDLVEQWWEEAIGITPSRIAEYADLPKFPDSPVGSFGSTLTIPTAEGLEQILNEDPETAKARRYWIDANYHNPSNETWWHRNWISGPRRANYEPGDLIFIYLTKNSGGPGACAALEA
jgi:phosphatidylserine/phosphatidylglycerophosphate/cardiolipin synthase-like enzyme